MAPRVAADRERRGPIADLMQEAERAGIPSNDRARIKEYVDKRTSFLDRILRKHVKDPELSIMLDSSTCRTGDEKRAPSDVKKWDITTLRAEAAAHGEARAAINAKNREIARLLCMEWMLMGDGEGARAVQDGKTTMFGMVVNGSLEAVGAAATHGQARRIVRMNGFDEDTCAPRVYPEPVPTETIEASCNALAALARAGAPLRPQDLEIVNVVLDRMHLPQMEEADPAELVLPRVGPDGLPLPPAGGPPDPSKADPDKEESSTDSTCSSGSAFRPGTRRRLHGTLGGPLTRRA